MHLIKCEFLWSLSGSFLLFCRNAFLSPFDRFIDFLLNSFIFFLNLCVFSFVHIHFRYIYKQISIDILIVWACAFSHVHTNQIFSFTECHIHFNLNQNNITMWLPQFVVSAGTGPSDVFVSSMFIFLLSIYANVIALIVDPMYVFVTRKQR